MRMTTFVAAVYVACVSLCASAAAQSFLGLGDLAGGSVESFSGNLSADGKFVTGNSSTTNGTEAFLWTEETGMVGLGIPLGSQDSVGTSVSNDGNTVVGFHLTPIGPGRAFRWTSGSGSVDFDPFPAGTVDRFAHDLSADGGTIVGTYRPGNSEPTIAYLWNGGTLTETADSATARGVSADGSVAVGTIRVNPNGPPPFINEAFIWTEADGTTGLGYLPGGSQFSDATGVSADGQVVVGVSYSFNSSLGEAFRWTEGGGMAGLGDLPGGDFESFANDTTADGSIVVGRSNVAIGGPGLLPDNDPFIWDETHGMRNLVDVLTNAYGLGAAIAGWNLTEATAISDDGRVIIGNGINPDGNFEAWRAVLVPEPSTALLSALACVGLLLRRCRTGAHRVSSPIA